ncbi:hypothetical protein YC2023_115613 [Brassica napus]
MRRGCIYRKLLTDLRRLSDEIPTDVKQSVGIPSELSNLKRLYNGHIYLSATVTWFVGIPSENTDGIPTTLLLIGMSSKSCRKIPTNHISSEFRRKWPTEFRRLNFFGFGRKFVSIPSQISDDLGVRRNLRRNSIEKRESMQVMLIRITIAASKRWTYQFNGGSTQGFSVPMDPLYMPSLVEENSLDT